MMNPSRYHVADGQYIDKLCVDTLAISKHHQLNKNYTIHQQTLHDTPTKITRYTILNTRIHDTLNTRIQEYTIHILAVKQNHKQVCYICLIQY